MTPAIIQKWSSYGVELRDRMQVVAECDAQFNVALLDKGDLRCAIDVGEPWFGMPNSKADVCIDPGKVPNPP